MRVDRIGMVLFAALVAGSVGCGGGDTGTGGSGGGTTSSTSSTSSSTSHTIPTTSSTTTTGSGTSFLGLACASDGDCGADGKCIQVSDNDALIGGGAAGGYCTKLCESDADCPGQGSTCLDDGNGNKECFLGCTFGSPELMYLDDELDPDKCHGRDDVSCRTLNDGSEVCVPTCGSDDQCDGRACDPRFGVCVDTPNTGKKLGEVCDTQAMTTDCAGICIGITGGKSMCTSPCSMGGSATDTFDCGGPGVGVCLYSPSGTGVGDIGYCAQSCTQQDQCQFTNFLCFNINLPDNGVCLDTEACTKDSDCANYPNGVCVETNKGKFCASADYPLGTLEPGTGGTGGGGAGGGGAGGAMGGTGGVTGGTGGVTGGTGGM